MDLRQRQAEFRSKALVLCKAEGPKFIEEESFRLLRGVVRSRPHRDSIS